MLSLIGAVLLFLLKAILWILGIFIVILLILLFTPMKIGVVYPETTVFVSWNGIKYTVYPLKPKKKKKPSWFSRFRKPKTKGEWGEPKAVTPAPMAETTTAPQEPTAAEKQQDRKKPFEFAQFKSVMKLIEIALESAKKILKGVVFEHLYGEIVVANEDKAKAAMEYGAVATAVSLLDDWLNGVFTIKRQRINVAVDFEVEAYRYSCDFIVYLRPYRGLVAALVAFIKIRKEGIKLW